MATIQPFSPLMPVGKTINGQLLKAKLEPAAALLAHIGHGGAREFLAAMLAAGEYQIGEKGIHIYGYSPKVGVSSIGVWGLTSAEDFRSGKISSAEKVDEQAVARFVTYRKEVELEASPIIVGFTGDHQLSSLIEFAIVSCPQTVYQCADGVHRIWRVCAKELIADFQKAVSQLGGCYLASGAEQLNAALASQKHATYGISTIFMHSSQLSFSAVHRVINDPKIDRGALVRKIGEYYSMEFIPNNRAFRPVKKGDIGLFLSGIWYKLEPRPLEIGMFDLPDSKILQDRILAPVLSVSHTGLDSRLKHYDGIENWELMLGAISKNPELIAFTLYPMSPSELMACAAIGLDLPANASCILPKGPCGILIHDLILERELQR